MRLTLSMRMRKGAVLPIAVMAFAIVAFLFVVTYAVTPGLKYPWSTNQAKIVTNTGVTTKTTTNVNSVANTNAAANVNSVTNSNTNTSATSDWKTYTSKQYSLTFKYPTSWDVEEGTLNSPYSVFAHPKSGPEAPTLRFWLDRAYDGMQTPSGAKTTTTNVTYAGRPAVLSKTTTSTGELLIAHIQFNTTPIGWGEDSTISLFPDANGSISLPQQIMETLSIADPTSAWKTYTNKKYSYTIKYPAAWNVQEVSSTGVDGAPLLFTQFADTTDSNGTLVIAYKNSPPLFQDGKWTPSRGSIERVGGRDTTSVLYTPDLTQTWATTPTLKMKVSFYDEPTGWDNRFETKDVNGGALTIDNGDIQLLSGDTNSFDVLQMMVSTFTFTK